jgi:hypothetical protein
VHDAATSRALPFGPWSPDVRDAVERKLQFRSLASLCATFFGTSHPIVSELLAAESDPDAAARALALLDTLPTLIRRRMLSVFGAVNYRRRERA